MIMRQRSRVGLLLGLVATVAIVAIAGCGFAAVETTTDTIKSYTTNDVSLQDADQHNATAVVCSVNEDWSTWELHLSKDQGNTWEMTDYYNGTASGAFYGDECSTSVGPEGENAIAVFREDDRVNVATIRDGATAWEIDKEPLNFTSSITHEGVEAQIADSSTWIVVAQVGNDWQFFRTDDGGGSYVNHTFSDFRSGYRVALCTERHGSFDRIHAIGRVGGTLDARYTTDGGESWQNGGTASEGSTNFDPAGDNECVATGNFNVYHSYTDDYSNAWAIYKSENGGDDWSGTLYDNSEGSAGAQHVLKSRGPSHVFAKAESYPLKETTDGGSWSSVDLQDYTTRDQDVPFLFTGPGDFRGVIDEAGKALKIVKEKPPPPGVEASATLFGNAQSARVSWHQTPQVFVRDARGSDQIFKLDQDLVEQTSPKVCDATINEEESGSFWDFFSVGTAEDFELREPGGVSQGLEIPRNSTTNTVHTCRIDETWNNEEWGGMVLRDGSDLSFVDYNTTGTEEAPIGFDGLHADELIFGLIGDNPSAGSGNWGYIAKDSIYTSGDIFPSSGAGNAVLPVVDELNDVAIDKRQDLQTRLFCATSGSTGEDNGTQCWNQGGAEIAHNTSLSGNTIQVYDHNVWIGDGGNITRYKVDTTASTFTEKASTTVGGERIRITKDGQYIVDCGSTDISVLDSADLTEATTTETISSDGDLRACDVDWSNSYAYTVDDTTVYKIPLFNHTASIDETGTIVGSVNTVDSGGDTQSTGDETTDDGSTDATDDVTKSPVTNTSALASSIGVSLESANTFMAVMTIGIFGVGGVIVAGVTIGRGEMFAGMLTTLVGAGVAIAYGWAQDWLIFLLVLVLTVIGAVKLR